MKRTYDAVSAVLLWGSRLALALLVLGVLRGLLSHDPRLMQAGLLLLLFTPVARVAVAGLAFWREGDRRHAAAAAGVLAVLLASMAAGLSH